MTQRKDYMRLFVQFAKKNRVWRAVLCSGNLWYIETSTRSYSTDADLKFGSKAAYEWLVRTVKEGRA